MKKIIRKSLSIALAVTLCLGSAIPGIPQWLSNNALFSDEPSEVYADTGHWSDAYMNKLIKEGVLKGDKSGNLNPEMGITRAEFVTMVNRSFGYKNKGKTAFTDVPKEAWYYDDISIAKNQGYLEGADGNLALPDNILKREEAVTLLCRALKIEGITENDLNFSDSREFSYWSKDFIHAATKKEYISGYPDQTFRPTQTMKRGEMSRVLADAAGDIVKSEGNASIGYTSGNVTLNTSGTRLTETTVPGDLYITGGVGLGYTTLENVTVLGDLIISGAGESNAGDNSIVIKDCNIRNLIIDSSNGKKLTIRAEGSTTIEKTIVKSSTFLEEGNIRSSAFKDLELMGPANTELDMTGIFENVIILGESNKLNLLKGYISRLTVDEIATGSQIFLEKDTEAEDVFLDVATTIKGTGKIKNIVIAANGCNISMLPENISIRPGVTATINGKPMTSADAEMYGLDPKIEYGPVFENRMPTSIDATVKVNKPGKVYWMIKNQGEPAPALTQMKQPKATDGVKFANVSVVQDKDTVLKLSGLKAATNYDFYTVLIDVADKSSKIQKNTFSTQDNVLPKFMAGFPKVTEYATSASIQYATTKDGTVYWAITESTAPAPTASDLTNIGKYMPGKIMHGENSGPAATECAINTADHTNDKNKLSEAGKYNLYMVIKDYADNLSAVSKIAINTSDVTPPQFAPTYPTFNSTAPTSLSMKYRTDEAATVYYAVFISGSSFPNQGSKPSDDMLTTKSSIQAVINGNIGVKSGKATSTGTADATVAITGLEAKKMYDVYVVLEDKSKNLNASRVYQYKDNVLVDRDAPTAAVTFLPDYNGRPKVTSKITMTFDKVVVDTTTGKRLSEIWKTTPSSIANNIKLYDREHTDPVGKEVNITFSAAKVEENKNSQTVVTFNEAPDKLSFNLASGNKYQFELRNIADTSGNLISATEVLRLSEFVTVPPQINLNTNAGSDVKYDLVIELDPQDFNVASNKRYDTIIKSDVNAKFNIYCVTGDAINASATAVKSSAQTDKGKSYSLTDLIYGPVNASNFEKFDEFKEKRLYGIEFTMLEGNTNKASWNQTASFEVQGLIGSGESLYNIAANPKIFTPTDPTLLAENVQIVSEPISKHYKKPFKDSVVPKFINNTPVVATTGDAVVQIDVMLDSPAEIYYVVGPKNVVTTTPQAQQIILGTVVPPGGKHGKFTVSNANMLMPMIIDGLNPDTDYDIYMTAKGTPPESEVLKLTFKTKIVSTPIIKELSIVGPGDKSAKMSITVDADSTVYWMAYPKENVASTPTAIELKDGGNTSTTKPIDSGNLKVKKGVPIQFTVTNLIEEKLYHVYATAENPFSATLATVVGRKNVSSRDVTPPVLEEPKTYITAIAQGPPATYTGTLTVTFDEYIYIQNEEGEAIPLTQERLVSEMTLGSGVTVSSVGGTNTTGAPKEIIFKFKNVGNAGNFSIARTVCDKDNNVLGKGLQFVLETTTDPNLPAKWKAIVTK